jgi:glycosyltransferase involved in cell wall biosynthesis
MTNNSPQQPVLSIVIPCYNYGHLVHETLDSLKQQTFTEWECLVINDGSTDNTEEVVLRYAHQDARYKYFHQENKGMSAARNAGIAMASGKYIQLLDSDDLLETDKFAQHIQYLEAHPATDIVYGDVNYFYPDAPTTHYKTVNATQDDWMPRVSGQGESVVKCLVQGNIMAINCPVIRKDVFLREGSFNETLRHNEDWEMFLRWAIKGVSFQYLHQENTAALVRMHPLSASRDKWSMRYFELELKESVSKQNLGVVSQQHLAFELDKLRMSLLFIALSNLLHGQFGKAYQQYMLFREKSNHADLSKNAGRIVLDKIKATLFKKRQTGHQAAPNTKQTAS